MKRIISLTLSLIFVFTCCLTTLATGATEAESGWIISSPTLVYESEDGASLARYDPEREKTAVFSFDVYHPEYNKSAIITITVTGSYNDALHTASMTSVYTDFSGTYASEFSSIESINGDEAEVRVLHEGHYIAVFVFKIHESGSIKCTEAHVAD